MLVKFSTAKYINMANIDTIEAKGCFIYFGLAAQADTTISYCCASARNALIALAYIFECAENGSTAVDISNY
jgi:hypothetical protein